MRRSTVDMTRALLAAGVAAPVLFVVGFTVAGLVRPGYSAMRSAVSDLGVGQNAWLQNANFLLFAMLLIGYAVGYRRALTQDLGRSATTGAVLIGCASIGLVGAVVFPATPATGLLHFLLGFLIVLGAAMAAAFHGGRVFRHVPGGRGLARYSTWSGIAAVAMFVVTFVALNPASPLERAGVGGLINRILAIVAFSWYGITAWWLRRRLSAR
ncbi:DUF998 domain-containing protein [Catellatospora citrea]|uniref:DUF998 domain-containing protein n=1 Tax=Catellatospora citrea TaxID=53366 RepID=A0A8J3NY09_9ACTN|nr:DUF998 domain-containing protein [Catellatospora citrea]RKE05506.1 putative membrane protein [Catellatospora citrea]GIF96852.1 hypothetical protein Cci01nite_19460 [Catellatospora citrea]